MLELPHLGRVPRQWTLHRENRCTAVTALALMDAGHIPPQARRDAPRGLVQLGLERWLAAQAGKLRLFHFELSYSEYQPNQGFPAHQHGGVEAYLGARKWTQIDVGTRLTELQRAVPGLGETVLHWIVKTTNKRIPIYTPAHAYMLCEWLQWDGMPDEKDRIEQLRAEGEKPDEIEIITRKQWDAAQPTWASRPRERVLRPRLEQLATRRRLQLSGKVARALLALRDAANRAPTFDQPEDSFGVLPFACWLRWSSEDLAARVWDDFAEMASQTGEYTDHIAHFDHIDSEEAGPQLTAWLAHLQRLFPLARALDELVALLAPRPSTLAEAFRGY